MEGGMHGMLQLAHSQSLVVVEFPISEKFHFGVLGEGNDVLAKGGRGGGLGEDGRVGIV